MPEGDAVWRTSQRLDAALRGRVLTDWDVRWARWATSDLRGATTLEVVPRGKHILHRLDTGHTLHTHLRMEGSWQVRRKSETGSGVLRRRDLRVLVGTEVDWALGIRLGEVDLVHTRDEPRLVGHLGPDPLGEWDVEHAVTNLQDMSAIPIGAALLDQRVIAGLGTIWVSETLFAERTNPWATVGSLGEDDVRRIAARAEVLLRAAIATSGRPRHLIHGRRGPCVRCNAPVRTGRIGRPPRDRQLYFCSGCQPD